MWIRRIFDRHARLVAPHIVRELTPNCGCAVSQFSRARLLLCFALVPWANADIGLAGPNQSFVFLFRITITRHAPPPADDCVEHGMKLGRGFSVVFADGADDSYIPAHPHLFLQLCVKAAAAAEIPGPHVTLWQLFAHTQFQVAGF